MVSCLKEAWPPIGDNAQMTINGIPTKLKIRNFNCEMTVLASEVLPASTSSTPISSPFSKRQSNIAWAARAMTEAKRMGNTVGP